MDQHFSMSTYCTGMYTDLTAMLGIRLKTNIGTYCASVMICLKINIPSNAEATFVKAQGCKDL